jgi:hypothetical protein
MGNTTPLSVEDANRAVRDALTAAGIEVRYLPSTSVKDPDTNYVQTVDSGALMVSMNHDVPGQGEYRLEMIFGRVTASTHNVATGRSVQAAPTATQHTSAVRIDPAPDESSPAASNEAAPQAGAAELAAVFGSPSANAPVPTEGTAPADNDPATVQLVSAASPRADRARLLNAEVSGMSPDNGARDVFLTLLLTALGALGVLAAGRRAGGAR